MYQYGNFAHKTLSEDNSGHNVSPPQKKIVILEFIPKSEWMLYQYMN